MNSLVNSLINLEIDELSMTSLNIDEDEYKILTDSIQNNYYDYISITETQERYSRYIRVINDWTINGFCVEYIKNNIELFLQLHYHKDLIQMIQLIKFIDYELHTVVLNNEY